MSTLIKDAGVWKEPEMIYVKDQDIWKEVGGGGKDGLTPVAGSYWVTPYSPSGRINGVIQFKDKWIAAADFSNARVSQDAWYWEARNFQDELGLGYFGVTDMAAEDGILVAVGNNGAGASRLLTTLDGETWIEPVTGLPTQQLQCVAKGAGRWVALDQDGNIVTSTDNGATWTTQVNNIELTLPYGIAHANELWVAVAYSGKIATSPNGLTWTLRSSGLSGTSNDLYCVAHDDGLWVVGSRSGKILTSSNGIDWAEKYAGSTLFTEARGITKVGSLWVAVGRLGKILLSEDGEAWSPISGPNSANFYDIYLGTNALVAATQSGLIVSF